MYNQNLTFFWVSSPILGHLGCIVGMTGVVDWVSDGKHVVRLKNGHPLLGEITGSGCMVGTSVATFCGALCMASKEESERVPSNPLAGGDMFVATIAGCVKLTSSHPNLPSWRHKDLSGRGRLRNCGAPPRSARAGNLPTCLYRRTIKAHTGGPE